MCGDTIYLDKKPLVIIEGDFLVFAQILRFHAHALTVTVQIP